MKMRMYILVTYLIGFTLTIGNAETPPDSCLKLVCPNDYDVMTNTGTWNPDSVKIDSCESSVTYLELYARKYFELKFTRYPFDTVIEPDEILGIIDLTDNLPGLKQQFQQLEQAFGTINFKRYSFSDLNDTAWLESGIVTMYFNDYQNIENVKDSILQNVDSLLNITYMMRVEKYLIYIKDNDSYPDFNIYPNPANDFIFINKEDEENTKIYSTLGLKLIESSAKRIDISPLPAGIYYIIIDNHAYKLIKL